MLKPKMKIQFLIYSMKKNENGLRLKLVNNDRNWSNMEFSSSKFLACWRKNSKSKWKKFKSSSKKRKFELRKGNAKKPKPRPNENLNAKKRPKIVSSGADYPSPTLGNPTRKSFVPNCEQTIAKIKFGALAFWLANRQLIHQVMSFSNPLDYSLCLIRMTHTS